ncbi:MAG: hypothetical protein QG667_1940, partial [Pseudomonadota bacterium]|nr:hypothetical protein [Pseudomonadota bacterium]
MRKIPIAAAVAGALACAALPAQSDEGGMNVRFSGFGTVSGVSSDTDQVEYTPYPGGQPNGVEKGWSWDIDTMIGAQVNANFTDRFSGVVQVLSKRNAENTYQPQVEWAFVSFKASPEIQIRAGRLGSPFYMVSDYRNVNYTNPWVRPPADIYGQVAFSYHDGIDLLLQKPIGDSNLTVQLYAGKSENRLWAPNSTFDLELNNRIGGNVSFETGPYSVRYGYHQGKLWGDSDRIATVSNALINTPNPLLSPTIWALACPGCAESGEALSMNYKHASFQGLGLSADWGKYLLMAEYTMRRTETNALADTNAWYITGGTRVGKLTPYATYSQLKQSSPTSDPGIATRSTNPVVAGTVAVLSSA